MIQLERGGLITLPQPQLRLFNRFKKKKIQLDFSPPQKVYEGNLGSFSKTSLHRVSTPNDNTFWEYLVGKYHYLGYKGVMGRFLKYIVYLENVPIACLGWTGAALRVRSRDNWIGWTDELRKTKLKHIVNNFRMA